ncbi:MAG: hypothetical protein SYC29_14320 [Planctomycetota bacterium]|nr:hypothetical protein [Planctomycetota bacterium]
MLHAIARNTVLFGSLAVGAVVCGLTSPMLLSARGAYGPTVVEALSPGRALLAVLICLALSTGLAILVARVCNTAVGMFTLGGSLFGLAWRLETMEEFAHIGAPAWLAVETLIWAVLVLAATMLVFRLGGPMPDVRTDEHGGHPHPFFSVDAMKAAGAGLLVLPVVWVVAQSPMKGQVIGAAVLGGMAAGAAGRVIAPHIQPMLLFVSPLVFGAIGQVIGAAVLKAPLEEAFVADTIPALLLPMPADYAAGSIMGVAIGLGLVKSHVHREED